jgi:Mlc titration factor MtfA (ptsG expression regulator)
MMDGAADGRPPLPDGITQREWFETFSRAFADFQARIDRGFATGLSDYAATNPAEFFAVLSEVYFEEPDVLEREYPGVMRLLRGFYTQRTVAGE